jgi:hypothetical protein
LAKAATFCSASAASMIALSSMALAADRPLGCYTRTYDAAHLREHRGQQVRRLWVHLGASPYNSKETLFGMHVWIRGKLQIWRAGGHCEPETNGWRCRPDTDGASILLLTLKGGKLHLSNPGQLKIFDDVTGPDLNEMLLGKPGDALFQLQPGRASVCKVSRS